MTLCDLEVCSPLVILANSGPYTKRSSIDIICWGSILCQGTELETKFLAGVEVVDKSLAIDASRAFWEALWDDFMCLAKGISSDGSPLARDADGTCWGAIMCFSKADLEKLVAYGRPSYGSGHEICGECLANRTTMPHTDLRHDATWRPSEVAMTNAQYVARYTNGHPMADSPFFNKFFTAWTQCMFWIIMV